MHICLLLISKKNLVEEDNQINCSKTMKFFTDSVARCAARIGVLSGFERLPDVSFETPVLLIYTKVNDKSFFLSYN